MEPLKFEEFDFFEGFRIMKCNQLFLIGLTDYE